MSNTVFPKTLARTMSALCVSVLCVGYLSIDSARNTSQEKSPAQKTKVVKNNDPVRKLKVSRSKTKTPAKKTTPASELPAPKDTKLRGIWLKEVLYEAGFRGEALKTAWAVAMKESTGRPTAHNDNSSSGDNSYGLFQINMIGNLGPARREKFGLSSNEDLFNPLTNAKAAYHMSNGGKNWYSWDIDSSGYNGGKSRTRYLHWLKQYPEG